jgi:WD40 repeat protein
VNNNGIEELHPACLSILEGGHGVGRPLYGAKYCGGSDEDLLLTWGVDGEVCVWDSYSIGTVTSPLCTLISHLKNYPIYALDVTDGETHIAIAGGGDDGGFFGIPIYIYDF